MSEMLECDELREKAKLLRGYVDGLSAPYVIPSTKELMALTMLDSAGRMEQAADTILELRGDLQQANEAVQDAEHDESMAWDRVRKAEAKNVKLREFSAELYKHLCITEGHMRDSGYDSFDYYDAKARELGIKVDE